MQGHNSLRLPAAHSAAIYGKNENFNLSTPYVGSEQWAASSGQRTEELLPVNCSTSSNNFFLGKYKIWFTAIPCPRVSVVAVPVARPV